MCKVSNKLKQKVVDSGICANCGVCVALDRTGRSKMKHTEFGPLPEFATEAQLSEIAWDACPGKGVDYSKLYFKHFGTYPESWVTGEAVKVRTGYSGDERIRLKGASGGVITQTLIYLLEKRKVDGVVAVKQGVPRPDQASAIIVNTPKEVVDCSQSVYVPVSCLDILPELEDDKVYAMTLLPEQSAALRVLQAAGHPKALRVKYVLGPYTGTAIYPAAIHCFLRSHGIGKEDEIVSLRWREGDWPGYLEIKTRSGRIVRSKKVYYNYLIPFFITQTSLQSMDFANEFADLAVGDAWSPKFENSRGGHSVVTTRSEKMESIIEDMNRLGLLDLEEVDPISASDMHGHMIDFKKRGGYIRNQTRKKLGLYYYDCGFRPEPLPFSRITVEMVISSIFIVARTHLVRIILSRIPERIIGPVFNSTRLMWKALSKPTKRKGLKGLLMQPRAE